MAKVKLTPEDVTKITRKLQEVMAGGRENLYSFDAQVKAFQRLRGLKPDGIVGPLTMAALFDVPTAPIDRDAEQTPRVNDPHLAKLWPTQSECERFFGAVGTNQVRFTLPYKMRLAWRKNAFLNGFSCNAKIRMPLDNIFSQIMKDYDAVSRADLGLDLFGGCLNVRKMTGGSNWSMHAYGIAVDIDPTRNQFKWGRDKAKLAEPAYDKFWAAVESEGAVSLGRTRNFDWMHFQFARL